MFDYQDCSSPFVCLVRLFVLGWSSCREEEVGREEGGGEGGSAPACLVG